MKNNTISKLGFHFMYLFFLNIELNYEGIEGHCCK